MGILIAIGTIISKVYDLREPYSSSSIILGFLGTAIVGGSIGGLMQYKSKEQTTIHFSDLTLYQAREKLKIFSII